MTEVRKVYFNTERNIYYKNWDIIDQWLKFVCDNWDVIYFAWGNSEKPKFVLQALVKKYWIEEAKYIYNSFCEAMLDTKEILINWKKASSLVMYKYSEQREDM